MTSTAPEMWTIGEVASACGVSVPTLRHYDDLGVVTPSARVGGARRYRSDAVRRVDFVRRAQRFGFSLAEIRSMLEHSPTAWGLASTKLEELRTQQVELARLITQLEGVQECRCTAVESCNVLGRS